MTTAFDALEDFERAVLEHLELVHALELVENAEPLADHLQGSAGRARGGLPAAKNEEPGAIQSRKGSDGVGQGCGHGHTVGEATRGAVEGQKFEGGLLRDAHDDLLQLGLGRQAHQPHFAAGGLRGEVSGLVERTGGPGVEDVGQHGLVLERRNGRRAEGFQSLQGIRHDARADNDLIAHAFSSEKFLHGRDADGGRRKHLTFNSPPSGGRQRQRGRQYCSARSSTGKRHRRRISRGRSRAHHRLGAQ